MITTTMSGDGQSGRGEICEECAKAGADQGPHTFILARETRCSRIKHMSAHASTLQSILDSQCSARGDIWSLRKPSAPHFPSSSLVSLSRCQWSVSDVTTCCDQACTPGGYLDQSPVLECGASAGIRQAEKHHIDHSKEDSPLDLNIDN